MSNDTIPVIATQAMLELALMELAEAHKSNRDLLMKYAALVDERDLWKAKYEREYEANRLIEELA